MSITVLTEAGRGGRSNCYISSSDHSVVWSKSAYVTSKDVPYTGSILLVNGTNTTIQTNPSNASYLVTITKRIMTEKNVEMALRNFKTSPYAQICKGKSWLEYLKLIQDNIEHTTSNANYGLMDKSDVFSLDDLNKRIDFLKAGNFDDALGPLPFAMPSKSLWTVKDIIYGFIVSFKKVFTPSSHTVSITRILRFSCPSLLNDLCKVNFDSYIFSSSFSSDKKLYRDNLQHWFDTYFTHHIAEFKTVAKLCYSTCEIMKTRVDVQTFLMGKVGLIETMVKKHFGEVDHGMVAGSTEAGMAISATHLENSKIAKVHNANVFFGPKTTPEQKQFVIDMLETAYKDLTRYGLQNLVSGSIICNDFGNMVYGLYFQTGNTIKINLQSIPKNATRQNQPSMFTRFKNVIIHELGHKFDYEYVKKGSLSQARNDLYQECVRVYKELSKKYTDDIKNEATFQKETLGADPSAKAKRYMRNFNDIVTGKVQDYNDGNYIKKIDPILYEATKAFVSLAKEEPFKLPKVKIIYNPSTSEIKKSKIWTIVGHAPEGYESQKDNPYILVSSSHEILDLAVNLNQAVTYIPAKYFDTQGRPVVSNALGLPVLLKDAVDGHVNAIGYKITDFFMYGSIKNILFGKVTANNDTGVVAATGNLKCNFNGVEVKRKNLDNLVNYSNSTMTTDSNTEKVVSSLKKDHPFYPLLDVERIYAVHGRIFPNSPFVTEYAKTNSAEWFAETFLYSITEKDFNLVVDQPVSFREILNSGKNLQ
jgi:hypothetical protein